MVQGEDFSFPRGENLELDKNPGIDTFTVIFEDGFAGACVPECASHGRPINAAEQAELKAFTAIPKKRRLSNTTNQLRGTGRARQSAARPDRQSNRL